jgi:hypothetical protein
MRITPEEADRITRSAIDPTVGAANRAQSELTSYYAASGNFNPGLNASMQEIQREQGRQASLAATQARLGVSEANRRATELAANARTSSEQFGATQSGNLLNTANTREANLNQQANSLLTQFPERKTTGNTDTTGSATTGGVTTTGPSAQLGTAPLPGGNLLAQTPTIAKPGWMNDRQWQDYLNVSGSGGGATLPRQPGGGFFGNNRENGGMAYAY